MIEDDEHSFYDTFLGQVEYCGAGEKHEETKTIDAGPYDRGCVVVRSCQPCQYWQGADAEKNAQAVYESVYDFLFTAVAFHARLVFPKVWRISFRCKLGDGLILVR